MPTTPGPFDPTAFYEINDQCGSGKMFASPARRKSAIQQGLLDPGYLVNGRWKNTGAQLNSCLQRLPTRKTVAAGFGGRQPGSGRPRKPEQQVA
jgi:hypothetical protein